MRASYILKFKFRIVNKKKSDGEMTKIKIIDLHELYNYAIDDFSI